MAASKECTDAFVLPGLDPCQQDLRAPRVCDRPQGVPAFHVRGLVARHGDNGRDIFCNGFLPGLSWSQENNDLAGNGNIIPYIKACVMHFAVADFPRNVFSVTAAIR
jgi:hypothetical protein